MVAKDILCVLIRRPSCVMRLCPVSRYMCRTISNFTGSQLHKLQAIEHRSYLRPSSTRHTLMKNNSGPTFQQLRFKGHAHWQNVKGIKRANAQKQNVVNNRLRFKVVIAVRAGGPNPKENSQLAKVMKECQTSKVEKAMVQRWIDNFVCEGDGPGYYELAGPKGTVFVVKMTNSSDSSRQEVYRFARKANLTVSKAQKWRMSFDEKGVITVPVDESIDVTQMDKYIEIAIESGAEDVIVTENDVHAPDVKTVLKFHCEPSAVYKVAEEIENTFDLKVHSQDVDLLPHHYVTMDTEDEMKFYQNVIEKSSLYDNIIQIYDNVSVPEE